MGFEGQIFGSYRAIRLLGQNGLGDHYEGEHLALETKVYIKILHLQNHQMITRSQRFFAIAQMIAQLIHPNITQILDLGVDNSIVFIVSEYAQGSLKDRHPKSSQLPLSTIVSYVRQVASALQYAHNQGIVHRDVKPAHLYIGQNDDIKLGDWELAVDISTDMVQEIVGTILYMAPEQLQGKAQPASDQYALGIVVYEWLSGEPPFRVGSAEQIMYHHLQAPPPSLRAKSPSTPQPVEDVVMRALAKDPKDRFESVQAFADALERAYQPPKPIFRPDAMVGQQFGDYYLKQLLGNGPLGDAYLAEHISLGSKAAVKIFKTPMDTGEFRNKVRSVARLQHPNIVRVLESGIEHSKPFLVLDYASHGSLYDRHRNSKLPLATVVEYVKQAGTALQEIHDHNMVLGILRPTDILLGDNDEVLLDGIDAIFATEEISHVVGTYTAPEQLNSTVLPASDQYTLALIAYELLSGKRLTRQETIGAYAHTSTPLISLKTLVPELPQAVADVIMKALSKDYKQRFVNVEDFAQALEDASTSKDEIIPRPRNRVGQQFGKYQLIKILGRGGFADVYLGKHVEMETFAAIKVLHAQLTDQYASRFQTEARTIAQLKHQYIVRVLHFGVQDEIPYLVMDQAKATLRDIHPRGSVLSPRIILPYVKQVATALQYAHDQRRIHRDIKPENMLLGPRNEVLLSDFGLATIVNTASAQNTKNIAGTAMYMSPEQFKGKAGFASDQYALGIVVYEWLCGEAPFTEGDFIQLGFQHSYESPPPMHEKVASIPPDIERVVMIALAKDPKQRFGSIQAFANAFEQACREPI